MKASSLARALPTVVLTLAGCTGLDPGSFGNERRQGGLAGQAGYSFDAGLSGAANNGTGGRTRTEGSGGVTTSAGGAAGAGAKATVEPSLGGEGGEHQDDASGGTAVEPAGAGAGGAASRGGAAGAGSEAGMGLGGGGGGVVAAGGRGGGVSGGGGAGAGVSGRASGGGSGSGSGSGGGGGSGSGSGGDASGSAGVGGGGTEGGGATAGTGGVEPLGRAFVFSEYVEGSASYKALELRAESASSLDGCSLRTYSNGAATSGSIALAGSVAAGSVYTLCSTTLADLLGDACDRATNLTFNGDDAVALECDGALIDVVGQIGTDPGTAWTGPSGSTVNMTLRRRCDHPSPDADGADPFDPDAAFTPLAVDTFDGLGDPSCG